MSWTTIAAIYFIIWWIVLFAILPWGVRSQAESGDVVEGTDPGAPVRHRLAAKAAWTTIVATVLFAAFYYLYTNRIVTLDDLGRWLGMPRR